MKYAFWIVLLAALLLPAAALAHDADRVRLLGTPHGELQAGDLVDLTWSRPSREIHELEILLSVDGGRHFALRVSPELEARDGHWRWRVPDVSAEHASLRLRLGDTRDESWGEPTPEFRIVGSPRRALDPPAAAAAGEREAVYPADDPDPVHESAWWSASEGFHAVPGERGLRSTSTAWTRATDAISFAPPRREVAHRQALDAQRATAAEPVAPIALPRRVSPGISRNLPLRE